MLSEGMRRKTPVGGFPEYQAIDNAFDNVEWGDILLRL